MECERRGTRAFLRGVAKLLLGCLVKQANLRRIQRCPGNACAYLRTVGTDAQQRSVELWRRDGGSPESDVLWLLRRVCEPRRGFARALSPSTPCIKTGPAKVQ